MREEGKIGMEWGVGMHLLGGSGGAVHQLLAHGVHVPVPAARPGPARTDSAQIIVSETHEDLVRAGDTQRRAGMEWHNRS